MPASPTTTSPSASDNDERRTPSRARVAFEALVAVDGAGDGGRRETFEAESVDVSASGMHLRTAYLPKVGTPLKFRFESRDDGASAPTRTPRMIDASGVVVWAQNGADGAEFGVRFDAVAPTGADALRQIVREGTGPHGDAWTTDRAGTPLRIYVDGAATAMRATLRATTPSGAVIASDLRTLALGTPIDVEDRALSSRQHARIEGVTCEIDPTTRIPQLIVRVRYDDTRASAPQLSAQNPLPPRAVATPETSMDPKTNNDMQRDGRSSMNAPPPAGRDVGPPSVSATSAQLRVSLPVSAEAFESDARTMSEDEPGSAASHELRDSHDSHDLHDAQNAHAAPPHDEAGDDDDADGEPRRFGVALDGAKRFGGKMKDVLDGTAAAAMRWGVRAKTTASLLGKRGRDDDEGAMGAMGAPRDEPRRQTTPVGMGAATLASRLKLPRSQGANGSARREDGTGFQGRNDGQEGVNMNDREDTDGAKIVRRKQMGIAAGIGVALVLGAFAFRTPRAATTAAPPEPAASVVAVAEAPIVAPAPEPSASVAATVAPTTVLAGEPTGLDEKGNPKPFGAISVKHGTRMILKLDGPITELRGQMTPTGFVVTVPNRKSTEAAGPLAAKDPRIGAAKVVNQPGGAELTITFKDAPPAFVVRAKGDSLEIVLAHEKAVAKKGKSKDHAAAPAAAAAASAKGHVAGKKK